MSRLRGGAGKLSEIDEDLLKRAIAGDRRCLEELLLRHSPPILRRLERKIPRRWQGMLTADDVMQETWKDTVTGIKGYEHQQGRPFQAWLHTIAERNLIGVLRMLKAEKRGGKAGQLPPLDGRGAIRNLVEYFARAQSTPSRHMSREENIAIVDRAVEALPETYRRVVTRTFIEGRPIAEVAEEMGRTPGAIHMIRWRALRRLGELLGSPSQY